MWSDIFLCTLKWRTRKDTLSDWTEFRDNDEVPDATSSSLLERKSRTPQGGMTGLLESQKYKCWPIPGINVKDT